jgi:hypothetical protein
LEFTAQSSPRSVASAIEACAAERRVVTALRVPWESDAATIKMAVIVTTGEGWALEHTNLGTITLADLGDRTRVAVVADEPTPSDIDDRPDQITRDKMLGMLTAFARQLETRLGTTLTATRPH